MRGHRTILSEDQWKPKRNLPWERIKNSWGAKWGNSGYVYISTDGAANDGLGVCGILSIPAIPYKH